MLQVFESHAEHLNRGLFNDFCIPYLKNICDKVKAAAKTLEIGDIPMVSFDFFFSLPSGNPILNANYESLTRIIHF